MLTLAAPRRPQSTQSWRR